MQKIPLSNKQYFTILGSGINEFEGEKNYYSTSSIKGTEILQPEEIITYKLRPSRANMQPLEGVVCFAKMSQTLKVFKIDEDFAKSSILSTGFSLILPNKDLVSSEYLKYYFLSSDFNSDKDSLSTGTTQVAINNEGIKKIEIPLPLPTQHLIVSEIEKQFSRLDEGLLSLRRAKENLKKYNASVLKSAVEGKLTEDFRKTQKLESANILLEKILEERKKKFLSENPGKKYKEPEGIKQEDLPNIELPEGWEWTKMEAICDFITKGTTPSKEKLLQNGSIPFLKVYNLTFNLSLDLENYSKTFVSETVHNGELARSKVFPGDVLMNIVGPPLGKVSIVPDFFKEFNMNQAMAVFRPLFSIPNKYIGFYLLSNISNNRLNKRTKTTAGQVNLTLELCRDLPIPLPPLSEQNEIVKIVESKLSVVEKLEKLVDENIKRSENLKQSILKKAFEGELIREE